MGGGLEPHQTESTAVSTALIKSSDCDAYFSLMQERSDSQLFLFDCFMFYLLLLLSV